MRPDLFWDEIRPLFGDRLTQSQVDGINRLINTWYAYRWRHGVIQELSYILATSYHETNRAMLPNEENLYYTTASRLAQVFPSYFRTVSQATPYLRNPKALANYVYGERHGNRQGTDDGWDFRGRGDVHLTFYDNYKKAGDYLGLDLVGSPDLAKEPNASAQILIMGMVDGWFTGRNLISYINVHSTDYLNARRVVIGTFSAKEVADAAVVFESALRLPIGD